VDTAYFDVPEVVRLTYLWALSPPEMRSNTFEPADHAVPSTLLGSEWSFADFVGLAEFGRFGGAGGGGISGAGWRPRKRGDTSFWPVPEAHDCSVVQGMLSEAQISLSVAKEDTAQRQEVARVVGTHIGGLLKLRKV
jgi:hypothetical protein